MKTQSKLLSQLKILETLYYQGNINSTIEQTLDKIISQEFASAQQQQRELDRDLKQFEQQYGMLSMDFHQKFHQGNFGDDVDFVEWNAFYEMWVALNRHIEWLCNT